MIICIWPTVQISTPGDFAVPGSRFYSISRPSDYMLTHLKRFAEEDVERGTHWAAVLESTVRVRTPKSAYCLIRLRTSSTLTVNIDMIISQDNRQAKCRAYDHCSVRTKLQQHHGIKVVASYAATDCDPNGSPVVPRSCGRSTASCEFLSSISPSS